MGLDYYYKNSEIETQKTVFAQQLLKAIELGKPMVIHTRDADDDCYEIMTKLVPPDWKIHVHCFTSSLPFAQKLLDFFPNLRFGFTGVVTFNNADDVRNVVKAVPLDRILLETDGPFLAPIPFRGKSATSAMIPWIAKAIAELKEVDIEEVFKVARKNTTFIYGF